MANTYNADISAFFPFKEIQDGVITYTTNYFAKVIKVGSVNLAYLSVEEQTIKISQLASLLRAIDLRCSIVKLERPVDVTDAMDKQNKLTKLQKMKFERKDMNENGYNQRLNQVDYEKETLLSYETSNPMFHNEFYLVIYGNNLEELEHVYENAFSKFQQLKLDPIRCSDSEIKLFLHDIYNPLKKKRANDFENVEDYKHEILPEELHFTGRKIKTDSMEASIWAVYDYQRDVPGGWLSHVVNAANTTCIINIKHVETSESRKLMDKAITEIRTQMLSRKTATQTEAERVQLESFYAIVDDIERGNEILKLIDIIVMTYADNEKNLRALKRETKSNLKQNNLKVDELILRQQQAYIAMLQTPRDDII